MCLPCNSLFAIFTYAAYWDIGDPDYECEHCHALFWYEERTPKNRPSANPKFSLCCMHGQVQVPLLEHPPQFLRDLLEKRHEKSNNFMDHIRAYNMMCAFTSMGGTIDKSVNQGRGPYAFKMGGQNVHRIGSLLPNEGASPQFSQLYIYDTENEVANRINAIRYVSFILYLIKTCFLYIYHVMISTNFILLALKFTVNRGVQTLTTRL